MNILSRSTRLWWPWYYFYNPAFPQTRGGYL